MSWSDILKRTQERTFVIESYSNEDEPMKDIEVNIFLTAKELDIPYDATIEDIEHELLGYLEDEVGSVNGYVWHEITTEGKKRDWLNPKTNYDVV
tara:strand:- start:145 stop:429 length:285 start_codon:yes stop_codon:yes gene_type:complete